MMDALTAMKIGKGALDAFAAMLVAHMVWFAFTGKSLVVQLQPGDAVRAILLIVIHIAVPFAAIIRRS